MKISTTTNDTIPPFKTNVLAAYNHYPFGMLQPGMYSEAGTPYRFGFNGMLRDDEVKDLGGYTVPPNEGVGNSYDFGARMYDPRVTRFFRVDPIGYLFPYKSNYSFAENNPIVFVDVNGNVGDNPISDYMISNAGVASSDLSEDKKNELYKMNFQSLMQGSTNSAVAFGILYGSVYLSSYGTTAAYMLMRNDPDGSKTGGAIMGVVDPNPGAQYDGFVDDIVRGIKTVWVSNLKLRGLNIEKLLGGNLENGFPVIDKFLDDRIATSIKSINLTDPSYQKMGTLKSKIKGYIDDVAGFKGAKFKGYQIGQDDILGRGLDLAIPKGKGSILQLDVIEDMKKYGSERNVNVKIIEME